MRSAKITDIKVYICANRSNNEKLADSSRKIGEVGFLIVDVETDIGVHGIGLTYHEVGTEAIRVFILETIKPLVLGMDPLQNEVIFEKVFHFFRGVGRKGLAFCALSAVDIALWDIKGKLAGMPLYKMLGGADNRVEVYSSGGWTSYTERELCDEMVDMVTEGYKAVKMKVGINGGNSYREDARRVRAVRRELGDGIRICVDANNIWRSATAIQFAQCVEDCDIMFFEEPVLADDIPGLARCRQKTTIPIATGEHEYTRFGARDLLLADAADYMQCDVTRAGGYTEMLKIIGMLQAFNVAWAPHCMEYMHMHLVAAAPNAQYLEGLNIFKETAKYVFVDPPMPKNGMLEIPDAPGLGLELNMDYIQKYGK